MVTFHSLRSTRLRARINRKVVEGLMRLGVVVKPAGEIDWMMGSIHLVWRDLGSGKLGGVADPRRLGKADGY
jgi:gamma-glutamyltranspeptidase